MSAFKQFARDQRGLAAVEFALLAPALIALYFGLAELTEAGMATHKVRHVASAVGDLASQNPTLTPGQITDIFSVAQSLLTPFPTAPLKLRLTSVTVNAANTPVVDWSEGTGLSPYSKGATLTLPASASNASKPFVAVGQTVIVSEAQYAWSSPIGYFLPNATQLTDTSYSVPRGGSNLPCPAC